LTRYIVTHSYDSAYGHLPPGYLGTYPDLVAPIGGFAPSNPYPAQFVGVLAYLLPYLEQDNLSKSMLQGLPADYLSTTAVYSPWWNNTSTWNAAQTRLKAFLCPSDNAYANTVGTFVALATFRAGPGLNLPYYPIGQGGESLGRTNYFGVAGVNGVVGDPNLDPYAGVFTNRSAVSVQQLSAADGTSNTAMFGEVVGDADTGPRQYSFAWMGAGSMPTILAPGTGPFPSSNFLMFSSKHPGVVQLCFGDGSVRALRKGWDVNNPDNLAKQFTNFYAATGWQEGQVVDWTWLTN
jgi:hypothetical protein